MPLKALPGFRDFFPEEFALRAHIFEAMRRVARRYAFEEYDGPPLESLELYTALKWKGVPVEYVSYPREGHGIVERAHQLDFMRRVLDWFNRYVK
jgi:hypothetical protein